MYRKFQGGEDFAYIRHLDTTMPEFCDLTAEEYQLSSRSSMVTGHAIEAQQAHNTQGRTPSGGGRGSMRKDMK
jgi:O-phosphoseryl-tRNA(Cys) synthetase